MTSCISSTKPILLIDMDGVIANYYKGFLDAADGIIPNNHFVKEEHLEHMHIEKSFPPEWTATILHLVRQKGFFENLPPIEGAIEALQRILIEGNFEPFLCTSPDVDCEGQICHSEKARWVEKHLGRPWLKRLILTNDKTLVHGHFLIDDKNNITGVNSLPTWTHVVFNKSYNKDTVEIRRRLFHWDVWPILEQNLLFSLNIKKAA